MSNEAPKFGRRKFMLKTAATGLGLMNGIGYYGEYTAVQESHKRQEYDNSWFHVKNQVLYAVGILASIGAYKMSK